jgi:chromosome segregation ATPase
MCREEQARLAHVQQSTRDAQEVLRVAAEQLRVCRQAEQEHNQQAKQLNLQHQRAQDAVERLEGELSDATPDAAAIEVLEEQLENAQEELQRAEGVFEDMVLQRDSINEDSRKAKRALDEADVTSLDLKAKLDKAHTKVRILQGKREEALRTKNQVLATIGRLEENKAAWEEARNERQREVDSTIEQARIVCNERVAVPQGKSSEQLIQILNRLILTRRETEKTLGGSQEELLRQANAAKHTHMEAMKEFESITRLRNVSGVQQGRGSGKRANRGTQHLIKTLHNRRVRWKQFRSGISVRARVTFNYLLSERKFRGTLSIDHKNSMLDIHVSRGARG